MDDTQQAEDGEAREAQVVALRDGGASWSELEQRFGLTRQQVRYSYQRGKRTERRRARRQPGGAAGSQP
jgi:hypothetical protein